MYRQVADQLAAEIASGELPPGHRVPSERVIAERHGLSRMTARQAVELLVRRGLVYRRPGSGTYVAAARVEHTLQWFAGFTEQMRAQGIEPGGRVLAVRLSGQDGSDAGVALELPEGEASWMVRRVRFGNGEPLLVEESHVPARLFPDLNRHNLAQSSLYDLMRSRYGIDPVRAHETIEPTRASRTRPVTWPRARALRPSWSREPPTTAATGRWSTPATSTAATAPVSWSTCGASRTGALGWFSSARARR